MSPLDAYEELIKLKDDPIAFAKRQEKIMEETISKCPKEIQQKLRQNNWCLEQELKKFKDPTARMNKMIEVFWEGVHTFEETLRGNTAFNNEPRTKATVLPFKKHK